MKEKYNKAQIHVWTPLIGFDKNKDDAGAEEFLGEIPFVPHGVSVFANHMDIIMQHEGMEHEFVLPPDVCSYYASDRNGKRERQEWTNYSLRKAVSALKAAGTETYLSVMADIYEDKFHREWISDHPEIVYDARSEKGAYNVLRRFKDGSFFEDCFIEKLCRTLADYGFDGFLPTDLFCPMCLRISMGDYSNDMFEQFIMHTNTVVPDELKKYSKRDDNEAKCARGNWLWNEQRAHWIRFYAWRWGIFWKKLCGKVHSMGKKVISLGIYCTDPFETYYCMGIDLKLMEQAGIDALMPNIVPTGMRLQHPDWRDPFHNYMNILPLVSAFVPTVPLISMLGVRDDTEEWDILHHAPCNLERDIYLISSMKRKTENGYKNAASGFMVCLGDSLTGDDWNWLKKRFDIGFFGGAEESESYTLIWSDNAFYNMLDSYIATRRWTTHKYVYEMARRGVLSGAAARIEDLKYVSGTIFVPNFDLLSEEEKEQIARYRRGSVVLTAMKGFDADKYGIVPDIVLEDKFSKYPQAAYAFNTALSENVRRTAEKLLSENDNGDNPDAGDIEEYRHTVLKETIRFSKVSEGFSRALANVLGSTGTETITCSLPAKVMRLSNGKYRVSILNPSETSYGYATVSAKKPIKNADILSTYPVLPVKYYSTAESGYGFKSSKSDGTQCHFGIKIAPGGMTITEVEL